MLYVPNKIASETASRIYLRKLELLDADTVYHWASDPSIVKYMVWPRHRSKKDTIKFLQYCQQAWDSGSEFAMGIALKENSTLIGSTGFILRPDQSAFIGYILHKDFWGKGFATEASKLLTNWLKTEPQIKKIVACTHAEHLTSKRVLEKSGIPCVGIEKCAEEFPNLGTKADVWVFEWRRIT